MQDLLDGLLEPLRKEGQKLLEQREEEEQRWQECQEQFAAKKEKVGLVLESLQELLRERQPLWLAWLAEQEEKMEAEWGVALAQLSGEASRLQQLIGQTERKYRQPDGEFLQEIQDTVERCRSYVVGRVERVSPRLQGGHSTVLKKNASVRQIVDSYKAPAPMKPRNKDYNKLNDSTAHPRLQCYSSGVFWAKEYQEFPETPERFDRKLCVLGHAGYTTGWNWWEVSMEEADCVPVGGRACWAIGVAKESVRRKGGFPLSPQEGIWALGKRVGAGIIAFSKVPQKVILQGPLQRLRVRLGYGAETVEFLDAETEISLYTFQTGPFHGETLRPFFYVGHSGVTLRLGKGIWV